AADVHPTIVRDPLDAGIVTVAITVTAIVRPCGGGQCDASAYAPPRPKASTAKMPSAPIASPPSAGPIASACPSNPAWTCEPAWTCDSHSSRTGNVHGPGTPPSA